MKWDRAARRLTVALLALLLTLVVVMGIALVAPRIPAPTHGWGANGRAWFDDEFWMDIVIACVNGTFLLLTVVGAFLLYSRQRSDQRRERLQAKYEADTEGLAELLDSIHTTVVFILDPLVRGGKRPRADMLARATSECERLLAYHAKVSDKYGFDVAANLISSAQSYDEAIDVARFMGETSDFPFSDELLRGLDSLLSALRIAFYELREAHKSGFDKVQLLVWPASHALKERAMKDKYGY